MEQSFRVKIRHEPITDIRCYALLLDHFRNIIRNKSEEHWEEQNNWKMAVLNKTSHWLLVLTALPDHQTCFQHQPPPGSVLLASSCCQHLEKSQGKKTIAKRLQSVRYHHKGFFMTHCWDWKNCSRSSSFTAQSWDDTAWSTFMLKILTFFPILPKARRQTSAAHQNVTCLASLLWISTNKAINAEIISSMHFPHSHQKLLLRVLPAQPSMPTAPACPQPQRAHSPSMRHQGAWRNLRNQVLWLNRCRFSH